MLVLSISCSEPLGHDEDLNTLGLFQTILYYPKTRRLRFDAIILVVVGDVSCGSGNYSYLGIYKSVFSYIKGIHVIISPENQEEAE